MEAIGGAAAALQLAQIAAGLAETTWKICQRLHDAPKELKDLRLRLLSVERSLKRIQKTSLGSDQRTLSDDTQGQFGILLCSAREELAKFEDLLPPHPPPLSSPSSPSSTSHELRFRTKWVLRDQRRAERIKNRLGDIQDELNSLIQTTVLEYTTRMFSQLDEVKSAAITVKESMPHISCSVEEIRSAMPPHRVAFGGALPRKKVSRKLKNIWQLRARPSTLTALWTCLGLSADCIATYEEHHEDHIVILDVHLPWLGGILSEYKLNILANVRVWPGTFNRFQFRGSGCTFSRLVDEEHPFMRACRSDDADLVQHLLRTGEGRLTDVDRRKLTPLAIAIGAGNQRVLGVLLENFVDLECTVGMRQSSPLQWAVWNKQHAVARMLLQHGASQDHVNMLGWNVIHCLWPGLEIGQEDMLETLYMLHEHFVLDLDATDRQGWTVLHRAATACSPRVIEALVRLGADKWQVVGPLRWNAMHHAVYYGNYAAFRALLKHYGDEVPKMVDARGWTLLHLAAETGQTEISDDLVELGVNPRTLSQPSDQCMRDSLKGLALSPADVAVAYGQDMPVSFRDEPLDSDRVQEIFADAEEFLPTGGR